MAGDGGGTGRVWVPRSRAARREAPRDPVERALQKWNVFCKGEDMLNDPGGRTWGLRRAGVPLRGCPPRGAAGPLTGLVAPADSGQEISVSRPC